MSEVSQTRAIDPSYIGTWRKILVGRQGWPEERFRQLIDKTERYYNDHPGMWNWLYHERPEYHVATLLAPRDLLKRNYKVAQEIEQAITGWPVALTWGAEMFDWEAARERVTSVLAAHGSTMPRASEVTDCEHL